MVLFLTVLALGIGAFIWIQNTKHLVDGRKVDE